MVGLAGRLRNTATTVLKGLMLERVRLGLIDSAVIS